ncbi:unnamed protein product [Fraxinus pennsylvanica]|uniref:peroxidase n=1 Tax=Fraxinus pennsylvanica TaxID=56036 RepID=A0AAD2DLB2_9LAMI|nr:unnamed protein product [Fraxinus pennsylvanica]
MPIGAAPSSLAGAAATGLIFASNSAVPVGGPSWNVNLGRRDSTTASRSVANIVLPSPFSDLNTQLFPHLRTRDLVLETWIPHNRPIPMFFFRDRIYSNRTDIDAGFASTRRRQCPTNSGDSNLAALDLMIPNSFDNNYFKNLM